MSKPKVMRAIKNMCIECMGNHPSYVKDCKRVICPLFAYRSGRDPETFSKLSESQKEERAERARRNFWGSGKNSCVASAESKIANDGEQVVA